MSALALKCTESWTPKSRVLKTRPMVAVGMKRSRGMASLRIVLPRKARVGLRLPRDGGPGHPRYPTGIAIVAKSPGGFFFGERQT